MKKLRYNFIFKIKYIDHLIIKDKNNINNEVKKVYYNHFCDYKT